MALLALFKRQEEKNREAQGKVQVIINDEDDEDFQDPASLKAKRNGRGAGAYSKRKRARIQDDSDESEEDVKTLKKPKESNKSTPTKKGGGGGAKKPSTTPTKKESKKKEIQLISDFFGAAPVKRTTRSTRHDKSGEKSKISKQPIRLGKRQVQDDGGGGGEVSTVPESPTEAILMEFDDEAVALALQEEELEMQKEKEKQIHDDEEFSKTLSALDSPPVPGRSGTKKVQPSPSRPPAKKLKLMMDKLPVSRSPSRTPTSTPTKEKPTRKFPESKAATNAPGNASKKPPQPTTRSGTRGGVRYLGEEEEPTEPTVEKKKAKTPPSASPTKQGSKSNSRKSLVKQGTTPPPGKRQTTPTSTRGKSSAQSPTSSTPKKSTPQPAPPPAAAAASGTTPPLSRAQSYLRYKNRGGPRAPGSKEIPQGAENCLDGLTFVITGVLESLEREEATDIIKKYGGKVMTNISGKTSYIIVGEEAGESKLAKARQAGTKQIDEDGLLDLIRTLPTPGKMAGKKTTPAAASKKTKAKSKSKSPAPPGPASKKPPQPTTRSGTRGGVRYLGEEEEPTEPTVEKKKAKTPPSASPTKQGSKSSTRKSPVKQGTTPPPGKRQTTPTSTRGKSSAQSPTSTTPKKSTPQPAPPPVAAAASGTTPSLSRAQSFLRYKNRGGPRAPGSKEIPQGAENCLDGLTFVITGVLESLEREEATDIIKKYGGKVTTNISGKTSYIIVGEEAGESKLAKAKQAGTKQIDEDGLLDLIRTLPTPGKTAGKKTTPAAASEKTMAKSKSKSPAPPGPAKPSSVKSHDPQPATPTLSHLTSTKSFYGSAPSTSPSVPKPSSEPQNLLWVDKYRPRSTKNVIGQQGDRSNAKKLAHWLQNWDRNHQRGGEKGGAKRPLPWGGGGGGRDDGSSFKAALLSGPPGIGKTTTATLVCEENGYSYVEMNASSTRNKRTLHQEVASQLSCLSLSALIKEGVSGGRRHALIMDEVDGMAGNEDRGGMQELIQMIKTTKIPIICICNDRQSMKVRSLASHCYDLRFQRPKVDQIKGAMMSVCFKEGLKIDPQALREMIIASGQDVRQVMHNLSLWSATNKQMNTEEVQKAAMYAKKNSKMSPFDVIRTVFCPMEGEREFTLNEKSDLFFHDYSLSSLFVQENYINARPHATRGNAVATLRHVAKAADSLCDGDLVEKKIRSSQNWGLLPLQSFYSSVIPGEHMKGFLGRPEFPQWLGQNSKRSKFDRNLQEIQRHTRLATSCSKLEFGLDYLHHLRARLTQPLIARGLDGVADVVSSMEHYDLMRSDWDLVSEMGQFKGKPDHAAQIPSKVKAAFTRSFNKDGHMLHYSVASVSKKAARRSTVDSQSDYAYSDMENEGAVEPELDSESDEELSSNPAIKVRKGSESSQNGTSSKKGKQKMGSQGNGTKKKRTKS